MFYLRIRSVADRDVISGILVRNGYTVSQAKIFVPGQKAKAIVLKVEEPEEEQEGEDEA